MGDTLEIFGKEFTNVAGFKAKDDNGNTLTYTRGGSGGGGTITIEEIPNATGTTLQITTNGSGSGNSGGGQTASGTVTGDGTSILQIPCSFAPDLIYVYGDLSGDVTYRGTASVTIIKDEVVYISADTTTSGTDEFASIIKGITGYNESDTTHVHATYSNGILSIDSANGSSSSGKWRDGQVYNYELVNWSSSGGGSTPSATQHDIYFEFSDETNTTITAYYDDSFISDAITATTPTTYGNKTVTLAQLDSVTWYSYNPSETWETLYDGDINWLYEGNGDYPYCWISSLGNTPITVGSVYRVTYNNTEYRCTAKTVLDSVGFGNPVWTGGTDDGSDVPFVFTDLTVYGAWSGGLNVPNVQSTYYFKIEHLVTS